MNSQKTPETNETKERTEKRLAKYVRHNAKRRKNPEYRAAQAKRYKAYYNRVKNDPTFRAQRASAMRENLKRNDFKTKARRITRTAIESGRLIRGSCEVCGSVPAHAHHENYSLPLDVRWLCLKHHTEHHAKATKGGA